MNEYRMAGHVEAASDGPGTRSRIEAELTRLGTEFRAGWELHSLVPLIRAGRTDEYMIVIKRTLPIVAAGEAASEARNAR